MRNPCAAGPGGRADTSTVDAESTTTPESSMNHKALTLAITLALLTAPAALPATAAAPAKHANPATDTARSSWSHNRRARHNG
jgi:hypothetical protein